MAADSSAAWPEVPVCLRRSDPARSTNTRTALRAAAVAPPWGYVCTITVKTAWLRDESRLRAWAPTARCRLASASAASASAAPSMLRHCAPAAKNAPPMLCSRTGRRGVVSSSKSKAASLYTSIAPNNRSCRPPAARTASLSSKSSANAWGSRPARREGGSSDESRPSIVCVLPDPVEPWHMMQAECPALAPCTAPRASTACTTSVCDASGPSTLANRQERATPRSVTTTSAWPGPPPPADRTAATHCSSAADSSAVSGRTRSTTSSLQRGGAATSGSWRCSLSRADSACRKQTGSTAPTPPAVRSAASPLGPHLPPSSIRLGRAAVCGFGLGDGCRAAASCAGGPATRRAVMGRGSRLGPKRPLCERSRHACTGQAACLQDGAGGSL